MSICFINASVAVSKLSHKLVWQIITHTQHECKQFFVRIVGITDSSDSMIEDLLFDIL
jgi:hypothetical protein